MVPLYVHFRKILTSERMSKSQESASVSVLDGRRAGGRGGGEGDGCSPVGIYCPGCGLILHSPGQEQRKLAASSCACAHS